MRLTRRRLADKSGTITLKVKDKFASGASEWKNCWQLTHTLSLSVGQTKSMK